MLKKRDRYMALFLAGIFLLTSSAVTIAVIVQMVQDSNTSNQTQEKPVDTPANTLQGKPLAGFTPIASIAELKTEDSVEGTGDAVKDSDTVTVDYTGAVAATGIVFQSSLDTGQPATFPLSGVITGWAKGIPGMKTGGTRRLLIPAELAYAANPPPGSGIPPNADLVFDVTLRKIGQ